MIASVNTITFPWNRIGIVGAGPAGLVAARILQLHGLACTVFDRESSAVARAQGGILDMHIEGGQFAFRQCRLFDEVRKVARYDEQDMILYGKSGTMRFFEPSPLTGIVRESTVLTYGKSF